ncbi:glycosyltransferase [Cellulomonas xiejunii]|uniref:glycosyltransferase n=1 Tax=Cellulomonas xiejunii TaxID=2968083 RepID=UPI001D0E2AE2|nr:glycosyltransferase [Cellulomonas xiejunii]MCC2314002.1 glycosyltransferase [Cellulomonas xiejunii]
MIKSSAVAVSIVVPTYNRAALLRRQLMCLVDQQAGSPNFQVVVADDGSSDGTGELVKTFSDRLDIAYHFHEDDGFRAALTRNAGARLASGEVLVFLDAGALVGPGFVQAHATVHAELAAPAVVLGYTYGFRPWDPFVELEGILARSSPAEVVERYGDHPQFQDMRLPLFESVEFDLRELFTPWTQYWTVNMSVRREDFWRVGGFDESYVGWGGEDVELGFRLHRAGFTPIVSSDAWAIESPHFRDQQANDVSNRRNAWRLWRSHPEPVSEMYSSALSQGRWNPSLEVEYRRLVAGDKSTADDAVDALLSHYIRGCKAAQLSAPRTLALGVTGRSAALRARVGAVTDEWLLAGYDEEARRVADGVRNLYAIGIRTPLDVGSVDLVIASPRLAHLWPRWGDDIAAESRRLGAVLVTPEGTVLQ